MRFQQNDLSTENVMPKTTTTTTHILWTVGDSTADFCVLTLTLHVSQKTSNAKLNYSVRDTKINTASASVFSHIYLFNLLDHFQGHGGAGWHPGTHEVKCWETSWTSRQPNNLIKARQSVLY